MKELLTKISSYNLFNYLFPGVLFFGYLDYTFPYDFSKEGTIVLGFFAYFLGLIISRIGSLVIEPTFVKFGLIKFKNYSDYIETSSKDEKLEVLSEQRNTYRTLLALILMIAVTSGCKKIFEICKLELGSVYFLIFITMLFLFSYSYIKQHNYISKRVENNQEEDS